MLLHSPIVIFVFGCDLRSHGACNDGIGENKCSLRDGKVFSGDYVRMYLCKRKILASHGFEYQVLRENFWRAFWMWHVFIFMSFTSDNSRLQSDQQRLNR